MKTADEMREIARAHTSYELEEVYSFILRRAETGSTQAKFRFDRWNDGLTNALLAKGYRVSWTYSTARREKDIIVEW